MAGPSSSFDTSIPLLYPGRVSRPAFEVSLALLLGFCWLAAAVRFYVRLGIQKTVSVDDGFLLFGLCCLTASFGIVFASLDKVYLMESFLMGQTTLAFKPGFLQFTLDFLKTMDIAIILSWISICSVKFSFLFLFRKLIDRLHNVLIYWWIVLVYVVVTSAYGTGVYFLMCPDVGTVKALQCATPSGIQRAVTYGTSQVVVDLIGDLLILAIPVHLIWKIKINRKQKFWLATSLCLTVVMISMTIIRISGQQTASGQLDTAWETYWNIASAEVGLIMTSATAFRTLYMSKTSVNKDPHHKQTPNSSNNDSWTWSLLRSSKRLMIRVVHPGSWATRNTSGNSAEAYKVTDDYSGYSSASSKKKLQHDELHALPGAYMTGIRTVISNAGSDPTSLSTVDTMQSYWEEEEMEKPMQVKVKMEK